MALIFPVSSVWPVLPSLSSRVFVARLSAPQSDARDSGQKG